MRSLDEIHATSRAGTAFSNMSSFEYWAANWCNRCVNDDTWGVGPKDAECPLITVAMLMGCTPGEWMEQPADGPDRYHCIEFRGEDDGGKNEPAPPGPIPGQGELFPAEQFEGTRMFADVVAEVRPVEVSS